MLKGYNVRLSYSDVFFFEDIAEAAAFFDQGLKHSENAYRWAALEPVCDEKVDDAEVDDDGVIDGGDL